MDELTSWPAPQSAGALAGALAHLARHLASDCPRSAYLAAILFDQLADDEGLGEQVRDQARQIVDILERDPRSSPIDRWLVRRQLSAHAVSSSEVEVCR